MNQARLDDLLDGFGEGLLDDAQQAELDALIVDDPAAAKRAALMLDLGRHLGDCLWASSQRLPSAGQMPTPMSPRAPGPSGNHPASRLRRRPIRKSLSPIIATITALAAIVLVVMVANGPTARERWIEGQAAVTLGNLRTADQSLPSGARVTATGLATICFADGTRVMLAAGTRVTLGAGPGKHLRVESGAVRARVAKQQTGAPFIVTTAQAQMTVVGTIFTVTVHGRQTELAVEAGAVRLRAPGLDTLVLAGQRHLVGQPEPSAPVAADRQELLIPRGAVWSYRDEGEEPEAAWREPGFDDRHWPRGPAPLGYDRNEQRTVFATRIRPGERSAVAVWFRHEFTCDKPERIRSLVARLQRDDGAVIYLNGHEVARDNLPDGPITPRTVAERRPEKIHEEAIHAWPLPAHALRQGINCMAVEVHQYDRKSSDLLFSLEVRAEAQPATGAAP